MPTSRPLALLRDIFFWCVNIVPPLRNILTDASIRPRTHYGWQFPFVRRLKGALLPQPSVLTLDGLRVSLDDMLGNGFALLRLHRRPLEAFAELPELSWPSLDARFICVIPAGTPVSIYEPGNGTRTNPIAVIDCENCIGALLHYRDLFILVRPDRIIMGTFRADRVEKLMDLCRAINLL